MHDFLKNSQQNIKLINDSENNLEDRVNSYLQTPSPNRLTWNRFQKLRGYIRNDKVLSRFYQDPQEGSLHDAAAAIAATIGEDVPYGGHYGPDPEEFTGRSLSIPEVATVKYYTPQVGKWWPASLRNEVRHEMARAIYLLRHANLFNEFEQNRTLLRQKNNFFSLRDKTVRPKEGPLVDVAAAWMTLFGREPDDRDYERILRIARARSNGVRYDDVDIHQDPELAGTLKLLQDIKSIGPGQPLSAKYSINPKLPLAVGFLIGTGGGVGGYGLGNLFK